jgi:hypothetical protein
LFSYLGYKNNLYYVSDSKDSVVDAVTYSELYNYIVNLGVKIKGVLYCKRTDSLLCEVISGGASKSTRFFKEEVYNLYGDEYTVLGDYTKGSNKILIRHNICGSKYEQEPRLILSGKRCLKCYGKVKGTTNSFKEFIFNTVGSDYTLLSEYTGANNKVTLKHNSCGLVYDVTATNFKRGQRCPRCTKSGVSVRSFEEVERLVNAHTSEYKLLSYKNSIADAEFEHLVCGTIFKMKLYTFLYQNGGCPICMKSAPEKLMQIGVGKWFDCKYNYRPDWLLGYNNYKLELDIYIPSRRIAIEYDGRTFHQNRIGLDTLKDNLCEQNGVKVIRLREYRLPKLNSNSYQIFASNYISLRYNKGLDVFEEMMNSLLAVLGIKVRYKLSVDLISKITASTLSSKRRIVDYGDCQ